ncbi:MAG: energy-coupling factor transport system permease protein [Pseudonocardiales bacterium]|jgi:energy-coupling factor transport system permease protein|nr:energy-coupling factor transport system permease protein [Pseudonocardiales bacterium]
MAALAPLLTGDVDHRRLKSYWLPRSLHPLSWWLWALGLTVAASRTTNPLLLGTIIAVVSWVVIARRSDAPWANAFRLYVIAGAVVVVLRVLVRIVFGGDQGTHVLVSLPSIGLPFAGGIRLFGDITAESLLGGLYDGLRLATLLICLGAANALANPRRLLRSMPPALHEVSTAVVVALSVFPQLAESVMRVTKARRLRPDDGERRVAAMRAIVIPVLEDALDRSLLLAASMDSRGYGRTGNRSRRTSWVVSALLVGGLAGICVGVYAVLDASTPRLLAAPLLVAGICIGVGGVRLSGRGLVRSAYRPDRWRLAEIVTAASGLAAGLLLFASAQVDPTNLYPSLAPLMWPQLPPLALLAILVGLVPAVATPAAPSAEAAPR